MGLVLNLSDQHLWIYSDNIMALDVLFYIFEAKKGDFY